MKKIAQKTPIEFAYINRELSWLAFNKRVLNLCKRKDFPVLERMRFLSIVSSNLDEFFEIRVAGLIQRIESGVMESDFDGLGPREQLSRIRPIVNAMVAEKYKIYTDEILPELAKNKIFIKKPYQYSSVKRNWMEKYFNSNVMPALTPMAIDPAHPFPLLKNKGIYVALVLANKSIKRAKSEIALIPIPPMLPRVVKIESDRKNEYNCVFLNELIKHFSDAIFPGYRVRSKFLLRVTRNSDLYVDEEESENLLNTIENELHKRKRGAAVRLEIEDCVNEKIMDYLVERVEIEKENIFKIKHSPLSMFRLWALYDLIDRPDLKFPLYVPRKPREFYDIENIFNVIREKDRLLHHPYESFEPIEDFIEAAASDKSVLAIKLTLYRTNSDTSILKSLKDAANNGKQVTVLVELKARGDEERNIRWSRELEEMGVHVVFGIVGLKTHCKICLVVRDEGEFGIRRYAHLGTGNYNSKTAKAYTDLSLFTANEKITAEVADLFNTLTGKVAEPSFEKLIIAPFSFQKKFLEMIKRETDNAKRGKFARIIAKTNAVIDKEIIDALYEASNAGVKIDLIVRGICGLIPQRLGMSKNIRVKSIVGEYLEHSRIYYFHNDGDGQVFAGSGDLMQRNLIRRIECIFPIEDTDIKNRVIDEILGSYFKDNLFSSTLHNNGAYYPESILEGSKNFSCQHYFIDLAKSKDLNNFKNLDKKLVKIKKI